MDSRDNTLEHLIQLLADLGTERSLISRPDAQYFAADEMATDRPDIGRCSYSPQARDNIAKPELAYHHIGRVVCNAYIQSCLISPCSDHISLQEYFQRHPGSDPKSILLRAVAALDFLHSNAGAEHAIVHGNLHMANIRVGSDCVHLSGFEYCGTDPVTPTSGGGENYFLPGVYITSMAPELMKTGVRTTKTDVYAFAMLIFEVYAGHGPFAHMRPRDRVYLRRISAAVQLSEGRRPGRGEITRDDFTDGMWQLMTDCWAQDPARRPTMAQVHERLANMLP